MELTFPFSTPVFYSANIGPDEPIRPIQVPQTGTTVLFTDKDVTTVPGWDHVIRVDYNKFGATPRRAARYLKLLPHRLFPAAPWSVWFDATNDPRVDMATLESYIQHADLSCFRHSVRGTARAEAIECKRLGLDSDIAIDGLLKWFEKVQFPDVTGLYVTSCLVRRHNPQIAALNELWMWAVSCYTQRDQISLPWVLWHLKIAVACLRGHSRDDTVGAGVATSPNPYFNVTVWG